jgi:hypothetical protein
VTRVAEAVRRLRALTEDQIAAARTLRGPDLAELNSRRVDALFHLRLTIAEDGLSTEDPTLRAEVDRLGVAERRLATIARAVLDRVARIDFSSPAPTYDRAGLLR